MTSVKSYYKERWASENASARPPAISRVQIVADAAETALAPRPERIRILDVGCGNGWILNALERRFGKQVELHGVEPSACGAANAAERVPSAHIINGTLATVTYADRFDLVVTSEVIEHVEDQKSFAAEIAATLKPDGAAILTTPNGEFFEGYFESNPEYCPQPIENWLTIPELKDLFSDAFDLRSVRTFNPEYFYNQHPVLSLARRTAQAIPGGRHVRCRLDRFVWREMQAGLNILAIFDRKSGT